MVGSFPACCARAASGHAAAAPPSSVMNSRRLIRSPRRRAASTDSGKLDAERLGAFEVDDDFEFHGSLDREVGRRERPSKSCPRKTPSENNCAEQPSLDEPVATRLQRLRSLSEFRLPFG